MGEVRIKIITVLVVCVIFVFTAYFWWACSKPESWEFVHVGMTVEELHHRLGEPDSDALELKGFQVWDSGRVFFRWRLQVGIFSGEVRSSRVQAVAEWLK